MGQVGESNHKSFGCWWGIFSKFYAKTHIKYTLTLFFTGIEQYLSGCGTMNLETGGIDICKTFFLGLGNGISSILRISFLSKVLKVSMSIVTTKSCLRLKFVYRHVCPNFQRLYEVDSAVIIDCNLLSRHFFLVYILVTTQI